MALFFNDLDHVFSVFLRFHRRVALFSLTAWAANPQWPCGKHASEGEHTTDDRAQPGEETRVALALFGDLGHDRRYLVVEEDGGELVEFVRSPEELRVRELVRVHRRAANRLVSATRRSVLMRGLGGMPDGPSEGGLRTGWGRP